MKVRVEFNKKEIEEIIKRYCNEKMYNDNRYLTDINISLKASEERGKRDLKCVVEYDYIPIEESSNEETLKILLRNTIDAYEDECDMNSAEHFVEKLKEETGITNEEYNLLFEGDKQILEDGSVITCKEE